MVSSLNILELNVEILMIIDSQIAFGYRRDKYRNDINIFSWKVKNRNIK
jgi:hypothetical protein